MSFNHLTDSLGREGGTIEQTVGLHQRGRGKWAVGVDVGGGSLSYTECPDISRFKLCSLQQALDDFQEALRLSLMTETASNAISSILTWAQGDMTQREAGSLQYPGCADPGSEVSARHLRPSSYQNAEVRVCLAAVKAVNQTLVQTKQPEQDHLKKWVAVCFQVSCCCRVRPRNGSHRNEFTTCLEAREGKTRLPLHLSPQRTRSVSQDF
ncbi:hypothetical protein EYF80_034358 [Liparis tanakae]|uniref:Uncharacterized protein n=1 Tax=Liparis tanakae TaxID=230148 RepID=A0A4Z2GP32_9TELE|nr:hypothetical protein EYF80_034358 [Liparis tanakae]